MHKYTSCERLGGGAVMVMMFNTREMCFKFSEIRLEQMAWLCFKKKSKSLESARQSIHRAQPAHR